MQGGIRRSREWPIPSRYGAYQMVGSLSELTGRMPTRHAQGGMRFRAGNEGIADRQTPRSG